MSGALLPVVLPALLGLLGGAVAGSFTARWWLARQGKRQNPAGEPAVASARDADNDFTDAAIDLAAVRWAEQRHQPEAAAGLMAERLKLLHRLGSRKGWC